LLTALRAASQISYGPWKCSGGTLRIARAARIWATAPYLHNGSVPNLWELLTPAKGRKHPGLRDIYLQKDFENPALKLFRIFSKRRRTGRGAQASRQPRQLDLVLRTQC